MAHILSTRTFTKGYNSRLDEMQAAFLSIKLKGLDAENELRRGVANKYMNTIKNENLVLPNRPEIEKSHVWHVFPVRVKQREKFQEHLTLNGIQTIIHYPVPPHKQPAYKEWNGHSYPVSELIHEQIISIPISPVTQAEEVNKVIEVVNSFADRNGE